MIKFIDLTTLKKWQLYCSNSQMKNICLQVKKKFNIVILPAGFVSQGVLSKGIIVWLDGARPANLYFTLLHREHARTVRLRVYENKCLRV